VVVYFLYSTLLYVAVWCLWVPRGKDVLFVYSDSPIWHEYMTSQVLPLVQKRAVILNWSERKQWSRWSFSALVFTWIAGTREFNPLVAIFRPLKRATLFRFWPAFKQWKHGQPYTLQKLTADLRESLTGD
jgi:hypothetical protein